MFFTAYVAPPVLKEIPKGLKGLKGTKKRLHRNTVRKTKKLEGGFLCIPPFCYKMPSVLYDPLFKNIRDKLISILNISGSDPKQKKLITAIEQFAKRYLHGIYNNMSWKKQKAFKKDPSVYNTAIGDEFIKMILGNITSSDLHILDTKYTAIDATGSLVAQPNGTAVYEYDKNTPISTATISKFLADKLTAEKSICANINAYVEKETQGGYYQRQDPDKIIRDNNQFIYNSSDPKYIRQTQNKVLVALREKFTPNLRCDISNPANCVDVVFFKKSTIIDVNDKGLKESDFVFLENKHNILRKYLEKRDDDSYIKKVINFFKDDSQIKSYIFGCIKYLAYRELMTNSDNKAKVAWTFKPTEQKY